MRQVCDRIIIPQTIHLTSSYCELLKRQGKSEGKDALLGVSQWYISYYWKSNFLQIVDSITSFLQKEPGGLDEIIWLDIFSLSQHPQIPKAKTWWTASLFTILSKIQNVLLILTSWDDTAPFTSSSVLFDILASVRMKRSFHIGMTELAIGRMLEQLAKDPGNFSKLLRSYRRVRNPQRMTRSALLSSRKRLEASLCSTS